MREFNGLSFYNTIFTYSSSLEKEINSLIIIQSYVIAKTNPNAGVRQAVNVLWLVGGHPHPVLDPVVLMSEGNRTLGILLNLLQSVGTLPGCLTITVVNW